MPTEDADESAEVDQQSEMLSGSSAGKRANAGPGQEPKISRRNLRGAAGKTTDADEPAETLAVWPLDEVQKAALGRMLGLINETGRDQPVG
jgi:hypothetical protein